MALKPRVKRRILWCVVCAVAALFLAVIMVPPMLNLNSLKPKLESAIYRQTDVPAQIKGDVHFSLMYRATIAAYDIAIPNGNIRRVMFTIPLRDIFNIRNAAMDADIVVSGARIEIDELTPVNFAHRIDITDSTVRFKDKDYDIIRGMIESGRFDGIVRTNQHKYEIEFENDEFWIRNRTNNLEIHGQLYSDGTARGEMSITTDNVNRWFDFSSPKIDRPIDMTMNFDWDGGYGFDFTNIRGNGFTGTIKLLPDGHRNIKLRASDLDFDLSFLNNPMPIFHDTVADVDLYGDLKIGKMRFGHLKLNAVGTENQIQITDVVADNVALNGGYIDADGAHNIMITMPIDGVPASCVFSGTPTDWQCATFTWGNISGQISVHQDQFNIIMSSPSNMPSIDAFRANSRRFGRRGTIQFQFADAAGEIKINGDDVTTSFKFARNKTFSWSGINLPFLPAAMQNARGEFSRADNITTFRPTSGDWQVRLNDNGEFMVAGDDFRTWLPTIDLSVLRPLPYAIGGKYVAGTISDLRAEVANQSFTGRILDKSITLRTDVLNLDAVVSQDYLDKYEELEFTTMHPMMLAFGIGVDVSLSADSVIYNGEEFSNFVYSLHRDTQTFSISDESRGAMMVTISRSGANYDIFVQMNQFKFADVLLSATMPLNVRDTRITAEADLHTSGRIAHDISHNISGTIDITFDGGYLIGIGIDDFYASAENITKLNAEYALAAAFDGGQTRIKEMNISGKYANGVFDTTSPFTLSMAHTDAVGQLQIANGTLAARLRLVMRGTSPDPQPIDIDILGNGTRNYSFSQIMNDFDPGYLRAFVKSHDRF